MSDTASATKSFISGACGGFSLVFAAHPFDLVKVRMQTSQTTIPYKSTFHAFSTIIAKDGLRGMYRGAGPVLIATPPILAINMGAYHWAQNLMHATFSCQKDPYVSMDQLNLFQIGIAGSLASIPTSLLIGPAEQLKIRLQIQDSLSRKSAMGVFRTIISNGGFLALFRGTGLTLLRDVPTGFTYFATYEGLKRYFKDDKGHVPIHLVLLSGGCAGIVNWTLALPIDCLKSRIQSSATKTNAITVFKELIREGGPKALWRGIGPTLIRAFPASAAFFFGVEMSTRIMNKIF